MNRSIKHTESEEKRNHQRVLDSPLFNFPVKNEIKKLKTGSGWIRGKRNAVILRENDDLKIVLMSVHKGAVLKEHKANGTITVYVISGEMIFTTEEETITAGAGTLIVLEDSLAHHIEALEETHLILTIIRPK